MTAPPYGYRKLPADMRCRCINLLQDGRDYWCCNATAFGLSVVRTLTLDEVFIHQDMT